MNSLRMICSTFIDWFAHSMRFLPRSASSNPLTSLVIDVVAISLLSPDDCLGKRSKVRGQIAEVTPDLNLVPCLLLIFVWFVAVLCGSDLSPLPRTSDLISLPQLVPASNRRPRPV